LEKKVNLKADEEEDDLKVFNPLLLQFYSRKSFIHGYQKLNFEKTLTKI